MTQYWGDVLAARSALWTPETYREALAWSAARLDVKPGRTWRNLEDTAIAAPDSSWRPRVTGAIGGAARTTTRKAS